MKSLYDPALFRPFFEKDGDGGGGNPDDNGDPPGKEGESFEAITSQDQLDSIIKTRLSRQEKKLRETITDEVKAALKDEQDRKDAEDNENYKKLYEDLQKKYDKLEGDHKETERKALVDRVASKYKLPETLAARLQGETEDDLETDAKALAKEIGIQTKPPREQNPDAGKGERKEKSESDAQEQTRPYAFQKDGDVKW